MDDEMAGGTIDSPGGNEASPCVSELASRMVARTELSSNSR